MRGGSPPLLLHMKYKKSDRLFVIVITCITLALFLIPTGFERKTKEGTSATKWEKARILSVDNSDIKTVGVVPVGSQKINLRLLSGPKKGDTLTCESVLLGQMSSDKIFRQGEKALVVLKVNETEGGYTITSARASEHYRTDIIALLFLLFTAFLIIFAGWTGAKAMLSFLFTGLAIWKILIPLFLKGVNPLIASFAITTLATTVIILLISGFTKKGTTALLGAVGGVAVTALLSIIFGYFFRIPGTVKDFAESLLYVGFEHLHLSDIFISGIFICSAGAVMDVAMDIAASQEELMEQNPNMSRKELIRSGFNIGKSVIGTMTTTLLFAYSGNFSFVLMMFMSRGNPMETIINTNFVSAEILQTLVGSFGLVLVAPLTALIGGYVYCKREKE